MLLSDLISETINAISANKIRTGLTILGIVIGIGSVVAMISIGQGAKDSIQSSIESIGSNLLIVMPGFPRTGGAQVREARGSTQTLTLDDAKEIESGVSGIKAVSPETSSRYQVTTKGANTNTSIVGALPAYTSVKNLEIAQGAFFSEQQNSSAAKVAVLGPTTQEDLLGSSTSPIGQKIRINKIDFTVIGVSKAKGGSGFGSQDDMIIIPLATAQRYLTGDNYVSTINIQAENADTMSVVQANISNLLLARHKISDPTQADFNIMNQADILATASSVTGTFTMLLAAIAGISLLVGGIGIMNMMLTTVTERTREIGLRKAIGAKNNDISTQFLMEATTLTVLGGVFGLAFGWTASQLMTKFAGLETSVSLSSVLLAFGVSAAIGIGFGYYPARRASRLRPIEALRHE